MSLKPNIPQMASLTSYTLPDPIEQPYLVIPDFLELLYDILLESVPEAGFQGQGVHGIAIAINRCVSYYISTLFFPIF